jgi:hypothetical protein
MISYRNFLFKIIAIGVLIIATVFTSTATFRGVDIPFEKLTFRSGASTSHQPVTLDDVELETSDDIYGNVSIAKLGNEIIELKIEPSISELDMNRLKDEEGIALSRNTYPVDVGTPKGAGVGGQKKPEESELVNAFYLKKIRK